MLDLSVLVCSVHTRYRTFNLAIQDQLWQQYRALPEQDAARVEILILTDNKAMTIGRKRNILVHAACGRYVQFIDDDDRVADDMLASVLAATEHDTDVITFLSSVTLNGGPAKLCRFSMRYSHDCNTPDEYLRIPNHLAAVKRHLALETGWGDINYGEDRDYSTRLLPLLKSEHQITRVLYYYDYSDETTESH